MSAEELGSAEWKTLIWQPRIDGRRVDFYVPVLVSPEAEAHPDQQVHKYQAMGEGRRAAPKAMAVLRQHGLAGVVVDLQYHQLPPDQIGRIVREVPTFVVEEIAKGNPVDIHGRSIGGVPAANAPVEAPEKYHSVGLGSPAGILNGLIGETSDERYKHLKSKLGWENTKRTLRQHGIDFGDVEQVFGVIGVFIKHRLNGQLRDSIDGALDPELAVLTMQGLQKLIDNKVPVKLLAAEGDLFFPVAHYKQVLGAIGCEDIVEIIPGLHATVRSKAGAEQYGRLALWTKSQQDARAAMAA